MQAVSPFSPCSCLRGLTVGLILGQRRPLPVLQHCRRHLPRLGREVPQKQPKRIRPAHAQLPGQGSGSGWTSTQRVRGLAFVLRPASSVSGVLQGRGGAQGWHRRALPSRRWSGAACVSPCWKQCLELLPETSIPQPGSRPETQGWQSRQPSSNSPPLARGQGEDCGRHGKMPPVQLSPWFPPGCAAGPPGPHSCWPVLELLPWGPCFSPLPGQRCPPALFPSPADL